MARKNKIEPQRPIESYEHRDKERVNNPPVGLVTPQTDPDAGQKKKRYTYDPHLDPQLVWAGKAEHTSFEVPTVSLHVHERIDPRSIIEAVRKKNGQAGPVQLGLFEEERKEPLRNAIEFYQHKHGWTNRLIAGDSLLVMNSLLEKEGMAGKVQMIYIDPPYGIKYGSNFQPFVNKRDVKDGKDEDLTSEPEQIRAFRDTWELGIHSYLTYLRDRLLLARELLTESGSIFVQIGDENVHHVRELMDEVFGAGNFVRMISYKTNSPLGEGFIPDVCDFVLWYGRSKQHTKFRHLFIEKDIGEGTLITYVELPDGTRRTMTTEEKWNPQKLPMNVRPFYLNQLLSSGYTESCFFEFDLNGLVFPARKYSWKTTKDGMRRLIAANRLHKVGEAPYMVAYWSDYPVQALTNLWTDTRSEMGKAYVVQTSTTIIQRCLLMTTDPGDLVFDPTCGSGTTAYVAEQWGRRWITCDTSRVAITLARQRLMTAVFDYYELAHSEEGVGSGFKYKTVPHVTLKSIANNPEIDGIYARLHPAVEKALAELNAALKLPSPDVRAAGGEGYPRFKVTTGGRSGHFVDFAAPDTATFTMPAGQVVKVNELVEWEVPFEFPADWPEKARDPMRVVVSFGPEHGPLEQRQVEHAWEEARTLVPKSKLLIFAAFQFDPEAAKDIDEMKPELAGMQFLKVQMNADLLTDDLEKKRASNESFWLIGQPDVQVRKADDGRFVVEVLGFDYYNTKTGAIESGGKDKIAVWMLDTDYDGRSLYPRQVFFPMADKDGGWAKLAKNLKAEIDEERIEAYRGTVSLPFAPGEHERIAVKIVDDRGIESLKVLALPE